jgi:competence protein ComEA
MKFPMTRLGSEKRVLLVLAWVLCGIQVLRFWPFPHHGLPDITGENPGNETLSVWVTGEVQRPGDYVFHEPTTVIQALETAGGPTHRADLSRLNLWARLLDGSVLRVPSRDTGFETVISLNRSSARELVLIPGIGPKLAGRIVRAREEHGRFTVARDLLRVSGIGEVKLKALMEHSVLD